MKLIDAWNALLLQFPPERIQPVEGTEIEIPAYFYSAIPTPSTTINSVKSIEKPIPVNWRILFEKAYFSHVLGHRKPEISGFELIIAENGLDPKTTLFVDDALINVEGAIKAGLKGTCTCRRDSLLLIYAGEFR